MTFRVRRAAVLMVASLILAACAGSENREKPISNRVIEIAQAQRAAKKIKGQPQAALQITRAQVDATEFSLIRITNDTSGSVATAGLVEINRGTQSYILATSQAIYLKGGFVTGTRGLGVDLMSAAVPSTVSAAVKAGSYTRVHRYLTADNKLVPFSYACTMVLGPATKIIQLERSYNVRIAQENCSGDGVSFSNSYAMAANGQVWQSSQWIGPEAGKLKIEQLK